MSERWRPSKLYRDRVRDVDTDGVRYRDRPSDEDPIDPSQAERVRAHMKLINAKTFHCTHNLPWQDCTTCSKIRSR